VGVSGSPNNSNPFWCEERFNHDSKLLGYFYLKLDRVEAKGKTSSLKKQNIKLKKIWS
jgi:hypothetical protein